MNQLYAFNIIKGSFWFVQQSVRYDTSTPFESKSSYYSLVARQGLQCQSKSRAELNSTCRTELFQMLESNLILAFSSGWQERNV